MSNDKEQAFKKQQRSELGFTTKSRPAKKVDKKKRRARKIMAKNSKRMNRK